MSDTPIDTPLFDHYAGGYEAALEEGLKLTGESPAYFAERRVAWMQRKLDTLGVVPRRILDFGCGTGGSMPYLLRLRGVEEYVGVDVSHQSLAVAAAKHIDERATFVHTSAFNAPGTIDLAFCNGVFHHIPVADRPACVHYIHKMLRPSGLFALWENNPWNPAVRYIMSRVSFDRDAITLSPRQAGLLLSENVFENRPAEFLFIFPRLLRRLRSVEQYACRLPLGGQYMVIAKKHSTP